MAKAHNYDFPIVGLGASAGGLKASSEFLSGLNDHPPAAFVLVQHLDPNHESILAELLSRDSTLQVEQVEDGVTVEVGHVYVIPPNKKMAIEDGRLILAPRGTGRLMHYPIDSFFRSLAEEVGSRAIGVILSGTASDGVQGLRDIKERGGLVFIQDPTTADYDGMPRNALAAVDADGVMDPKALAREVVRLAKHPLLARTATSTEEEAAKPGDGYRRIMRILRNDAGIDFESYKTSMVQRRIARRMMLKQIGSMDEYAEVVSTDIAERHRLHNDLLIHVTEFFRDPEEFDALRDLVLPELIPKSRKEDLRIWVPGCATGEEAYSVLMVVLEYLSAHKIDLSVSLFATDVGESALETARMGLYPPGVAERIPEDRLIRFMKLTDGGYRINKALREMCVFARQDITKDPPFSRMDLVSFRNVLIYLNSDAQRHALSVIQYAVKPGGYLMLGSSETINERVHAFRRVGKSINIYRRTSDSVTAPTFTRSQPKFPEHSGGQRQETDPCSPREVEREADDLVLERYAPPRVLVDAKGDIIHLTERISSYVRLPSGPQHMNIFEMAREGLEDGLRELFEQLQDDGLGVVRDRLRVASPTGWRDVDVEVVALDEACRYRLVLFSGDEDQPLPDTVPMPGPDSEDLERDNVRLRRERDLVRRRMERTIADKEAANEELRAANEEIQSSNEELQSVNEELETAKEELQSTNEELNTVNDELRGRNVELGRLNDDLENTLATVDIPLLILDRTLCVRRYTPAFRVLVPLTPPDVGRSLNSLSLGLKIDDLDVLVKQSISELSVVSREVQHEDGRWYSLQIRPYRTHDEKIEGALLRFVDITDLRGSLNDVERSAQLSIALGDIDFGVIGAMSRGDIFREALQRTCEALSCETAAISLRVDDEWEPVAVYGLSDNVLEHRLRDDENRHALLALQKRAPVLVDDTAVDERVDNEVMQRYGIRSVAAVPLYIEDEPLGALFLNYHSSSHVWDDLEARFLRRLGAVLSLALRNQSLLDSERELRSQADAEIAISNALIESIGTFDDVPEPRVIVRKVTEVLSELTSRTRVVMRGVNRSTAELSDEDVKLDLKDIDEDVSGEIMEMLKSGQVFVRDHRNRADEWSPYPDAVCVLYAPIMVDDRLFGYIAIDTPGSDENFDAQQKRAIGAIARQVSLVLWHARQYERSRERHGLMIRLNEISARLGEGLEAYEALTLAVQNATEILGAYGGAAIVRTSLENWEVRYALGDMESASGGHAHARPTFTADAVPLVLSEKQRWIESLLKDLDVSTDLVVPFSWTGTTDALLVFSGVKYLELGDLHTWFLDRLLALSSSALEQRALYVIERHTSQTLQASLTSVTDTVEGADVSVFYQSATTTSDVGGDFYDFFALDDRTCAIVMGDVAGKGVDAARLTALCRNSLRAYAYDGASPSEAMTKANSAIWRATDITEFATILFAILDTASGVLTYASGGHPPAIVTSSTGETRLLVSEGTLVGAFEEATFEEHETRMAPGDILFVYTDGIVESRDEEGRLFGEGRLLDVVRPGGLTGEELPETVYQAVNDFARGHIHDDIAMIAVTLESTQE